jgi:Zn finger protein HypA/HybF involved in hydrogenase expression
LKVESIHACPNGCILYQGKEYEKLEACPMCEAEHYKISRDDPCDVQGVKKKKKRKKKKIPAKVVWYFPVIP